MSTLVASWPAFAVPTSDRNAGEVSDCFPVPCWVESTREYGHPDICNMKPEAEDCVLAGPVPRGSPRRGSYPSCADLHKSYSLCAGNDVIIAWNTEAVPLVMLGLEASTFTNFTKVMRNRCIAAR